MFGEHPTTKNALYQMHEQEDGVLNSMGLGLGMESKTINLGTILDRFRGC